MINGIAAVYYREATILLENAAKTSRRIAQMYESRMKQDMVEELAGLLQRVDGVLIDIKE